MLLLGWPGLSGGGVPPSIEISICSRGRVLVGRDGTGNGPELPPFALEEEEEEEEEEESAAAWL